MRRSILGNRMHDQSLLDLPEDQHLLDLFFMKQALKEAKKAFEKDEVPVGAVIVLEKKILAKGHNQVELLKDATAHAEMLCLTAASGALSNWRLLDTTLYTTLEPCSMCAGALFAARVKRLVFGAPDIRLGACGSFVDLFSLKHPMHEIEVTKRVMEEECAALMKEFFRKTRKHSIKENF